MGKVGCRKVGLTSVKTMWDVHGIAHDEDHEHGDEAHERHTTAFTEGRGALVPEITAFNPASAREGDLSLLRVMSANRARLFGTVMVERLVTAVQRSSPRIGIQRGWNAGGHV